MKFSISSALLLGSSFAAAANVGKFRERVDQHYGRAERMAAAQPEPRSLEERSEGFRYLNNETKPYMVESLPLVPFDIGEMYSGNIPINMNNASRNLFFVFYPKIGEPSEDLVIWLNGGPGCSSLEGFFQENGPFVWLPGTAAPVVNQYSWANLSNMLWVEQPVGTGFSQGEVTATNELDVAADFIGFFKNFEDLFGIKNYRIFVTGESYAGRYVPYISAGMLDQNDTTYFNLSGALTYDPSIGDFVAIQEEYVTVPFVLENNNILNLNDSFVQQLESLHQSCGYADYLKQYYTYPASGVQPPVFFNYTQRGECDVFNAVNNAIFDVNPCFDIYQIALICPILSDPLGFPTELTQDQYNTTYFNRTDVKQAMHAPLDVSWAECAANPVFVGNGGPELGEDDESPDPIQGVLPQVIEATNRVLVGNGDWDMVIISNGTRLAIQNMTWNGKLGFEQEPGMTPIVITSPDLQYEGLFNNSVNGPLGFAGLDGPQGTMGIQHYERGLMYVETYQSGHMQPEFQPRVAYAHMQWLLGQTSIVGSS